MKPKILCNNPNLLVLVMGLIFIILMQGCKGFGTYDPGEGGVNVNTYVIGDCDKMDFLLAEEGIPGPGGCFNTLHSGSATGFWNMDNNTVIQASENKVCSGAGSKKCRNPGSMCNSESGLNYCYSTWTNTPANTCLCACGQL